MSSRASIEPSSLGLDAPEASRSTLIAIVLLGIGFDLTFNGQRPGIAVPLFALSLAAAFRTVARPSRSTDLLLGGAVLLSLFPALRGSQDLATFDVFAASALLGLAATQDLQPITSVTVIGLTHRAFAIGRRTLAVPRFVAAPITSPAERGRARRILRVVGIAAPVLILFAALLASGDRVFARMLSSFLPEWDAVSILAHITFTLFGSALVAILWRSALGNGDEPRDGMPLPSLPSIGSAEWGTVLAGIDLLFASFVVVQVRYLFGGNERVDVTSGLTYAEYARSGFLQLALAAALTVVVIVAAWDAGRRDGPRQERWFRGLVTAMVGMTGVVLASSLMRLALYEGTFGFTLNRFLGYVAIASIAAVLLVLLAAIWSARRDRLVAGFILVGFVALLAVNVMNPDRFVADRNVDRFEATGRIDVAYLGWGLGPDGVPVAATLLGRLSPEDTSTLRSALCERLEGLSSEPSWRSINAGRAAARQALENAGITPATCASPEFRLAR